MIESEAMTPGTMVGARYEIGDILGRGGFSVTYRAIDRQLLDEPRVVKELHLGHVSNDIAVSLFKREASVLLKLDNKRVPKVHALIEDHGRLFLVQDFIKGETLESKLTREGRLSEDRVRDIMLQLLDVLEYLHTHDPQVIHRDIKPANIMERPDGSVVLIDFGAVRETQGPGVTAGRTAVSSEGYSPPEQYMGHASPASDVYALGATALNLVTGKHPHEWTNEAGDYDLLDKELPVSPAFAALLERMLAKRSARFPSARSVRDAMTGTGATVATDGPTKFVDGGSSTAITTGKTTVAARGAPTSAADVGGKTRVASSTPQREVSAAKQKSFLQRWWLGIAAGVVGILVVAAVLQPDSSTAKPDASNGQGKAPIVEQPKSAPEQTKTPVLDQKAPPPNASLASNTSAKTSAKQAPPRTTPVQEQVTTPKQKDTAEGQPSGPAPVAAAPAPDPCIGVTRCYNARRFTATLMFVTASQDRHSNYTERNVKLSFRIKNLGTQPLVLAYRAGSGSLVDDQGNKYTNDTKNESYVKGIGTSDRSEANPEFTIPAGETGDFILDNFLSINNNVIYGITYNYDFTLDELNVTNGRARVARSTPISFREFSEPTKGKDDLELRESLDEDGPSAIGLSQQDPCGGASNCYSTGKLVFKATRLWSRREVHSNYTEWWMKVSLRIQNTGDKDIVLVYKEGSGQLTDDGGHRFRNEAKGGELFLRGIGTLGQSNAMLWLQPGKSKEVTLDNWMTIYKPEVEGTAFAYDVGFQEVEPAPGGQARPGRSYTVSLQDLKESPRIAAKAADTLSFDAGPFTARLVETGADVTPHSNYKSKIVGSRINIKNTSDKPITLAYRASTQSFTDDRGHVFRNERRGGAAYVQGIGVHDENEVGMNFVLAPGQAKDVVFKGDVDIYDSDREGKLYDFDLVLDECETTPSRQVRCFNSYAVSFHDFQNTPMTAKKAIKGIFQGIIKKP